MLGVVLAAGLVCWIGLLLDTRFGEVCRCGCFLCLLTLVLIVLVLRLFVVTCGWILSFGVLCVGGSGLQLV